MHRLTSGRERSFLKTSAARVLEPFIGKRFFTPFQQVDFYGDAPVNIEFVKVPVARIAKEVFYIPKIALLLVVVMLRRRGQTKPAF